MRHAGRQTAALLVDAYRELNARKMFWITLALSGLVVGVFAAFGVNDRGITLLWWVFDSDVVNARVMEPRLFYTWAFATIGVPVWLTWAAAILALISTASIFPDFVSSGSIELLLSRPIGRLRLYLTKYLTGLLFVAAQVIVFTVASFAVIAIRGKSLEWGVFLAAPIVVVFFSYLFCVLAVVGQVTRSTVAALLVTILFWIMVFAVNATEGTLLMQRERYSLEVERLQRRLSAQEEAARRIIADHASGEARTGLDEGEEPAELEPEQANPFLARTRQQLAEAQPKAETWTMWHRRILLARAALPKTQETIGLLGRGLISSDEAERFGPRQRAAEDDDEIEMNDPRVARRMEGELRDRPLWWIIGTSLLFEAVVLGFGAWRFCRRDF
jgi:hypothetical protein